MKTLEQWAIEYYGLQRDKEQKSARWRAIQPSLQRMVTFLGQVVADKQTQVVGNPDVPKQVGK